MISIIRLLVAAAVISLQCGFEVNAQFDNTNLSNNVDNNLLPTVVSTPKKQRRLRKYVRIWSHPEEEIQRGAGERVELDCVAMGNPVPVVRWEKNGQTVVDVEEFNDIIESNPSGIALVTSKLILSSTTPGEDQYSCVATSGLLTDSATTTVYTLPSEDSEEDLMSLEKFYLPTKPTINYYYNDLLQNIGGVVVLPCRYNSIMKSQLIWYLPDERFVKDGPRMKVLPSGDLLINGLRWSDMGNFTCTVKNLYGKDSIQTFVYPMKGIK